MCLKETTTLQTFLHESCDCVSSSSNLNALYMLGSKFACGDKIQKCRQLSTVLSSCKTTRQSDITDPYGREKTGKKNKINLRRGLNSLNVSNNSKDPNVCSHFCAVSNRNIGQKMYKYFSFILFFLPVSSLSSLHAMLFYICSRFSADPDLCRRSGNSSLVSYLSELLIQVIGK